MTSLGTLGIDFSCEKHEIYRDHVLYGGNYTKARPFCSRDQNTPNVMQTRIAGHESSQFLLVFLSLSIVAIEQGLALSRLKSKRLVHLVSTF